MRFAALYILIAIVAFVPQIAIASPYIESVFNTEIGDYRWGIWKYVDVPVDLDTSMLNIDDGKDWKFVTYWFFSLGRYFEVRISQGILILLGICTAFVTAWLLWNRIQRRKLVADK